MDDLQFIKKIVMRSVCLRFCILGLLLLLTSCTKIRDLFIEPTPREVYKREFSEGNPRFKAWKTVFKESLTDSLSMLLPYQEAGEFNSDEMNAYSYNVNLEQGETFMFEVASDSTNARIFIDFFRQTDDSLNTYEIVKRNKPDNRNFRYEVVESGTYKIIVQPAMDVQTPFILTAYTMPTYTVPVAGHDNAAIKSFWGDPRDAGRRRHEGIDIFAPRGTPVVAATDGRVSFTGNRGLGGKQVWMRTGLFGGKSLYYAHLDSIVVSGSGSVDRGDTLGFVGNTGNARTTSPHLHFGIYESDGAVNPLPFVYLRTRPPLPEALDDSGKREVVVHAQIANLRTAASMQGEKIGEARRGETLQLLGEAGNWRHIKTGEDLEAFIHENLVD